MGIFYLAIDISEDSGRHIMGWQEDGKLKLEEVYSFKTKYFERDGKRLWDLQYIFEQIKAGIAGCREKGRLPVLVGLTACDGYFVLLDQDDKVIDDMVFCLDTIDTDSEKNHYTAYIGKTACFLMLSDYFNFLLTGRKQCEYTNLLPRKLISWDKKDWDEEYITGLGFDLAHFPPVAHPGSVIANLTLEVTEEVGYDFIVIQPASRKASAAIVKLPEPCCGDELKPSIGCISILMISSHELKDLEAAREIISNSFYIHEDKEEY